MGTKIISPAIAASWDYSTVMYLDASGVVCLKHTLKGHLDSLVVRGSDGVRARTGRMPRVRNLNSGGSQKR